MEVAELGRPVGSAAPQTVFPPGIVVAGVVIVGVVVVGVGITGAGITGAGGVMLVDLEDDA